VKNDYLKKAYLPNPVIAEDGIEYVFMEIMLYGETLESKKHIHEIYRIFSLLSGESYEWKLEKGAGFYRNKITEMVKKLKNDSKCGSLSKIYKKFSLDKDIRDFFAHNDFVIEYEKKRIRYYKKNKNKDRIEKEISFDKWTKMFLYQTELCCQLYDKMKDRRSSFEKDTGKDEVQVTIPDNEGNFREATLNYWNNNGNPIFHF